MVVEKVKIFFPKIFSTRKGDKLRKSILEKQKKMKDKLTRELTMAETRLERAQAKQAKHEELEKTRFEQEQVKMLS